MPDREPIPNQVLEEQSLPDVHAADAALSSPGNAPPAAAGIAFLKPRGIAPLWHTLVLVFAILGYSVWGAVAAQSGAPNPLHPTPGAAHAASDGVDRVRLIRYALTGALEVAIVVWIAFGLRLRKIPFRSLFGAWPRGLNDTTKEVFVAAGFWLCSMAILFACAATWLVVQNRIYQRETAAPAATAPPAPGAAKPKSPEQQQAELVGQLTQLAPANGIEIAAWGLLCLLVGFSEEIIFRGYLQSQSIDLLRNVPVGLIFTAIVFGAAHGYQGVRGIVLISIYGSLFGVLVRLRKNLLPGMIAHSWHDFATGMALALIRSSHLLEHLPTHAK